MEMSTGNVCGSSRISTLFTLCLKGFCIDSVLVPSFCDGSAISIVMSASNNLGTGPNSKPFNVQGILSDKDDINSGLRRVQSSYVSIMLMYCVTTPGIDLVDTSQVHVANITE